MRGLTRSTFGLVLLATACASAERPAAVPSELQVTKAGATDTVGFELATGVVVAPWRGALYLARPGGGIEALDAESGQPSWSSEEAARPLLVAGGRLLAQRETGAGLPLVLLDTGDGGLVRRLDVSLPGGVRAAVDGSPHAEFRISARAAGDDAILEWEYLERHALGVSPPDAQPYARRELGALRLDLDSGEATPLSSEQAAVEGDEPLPAPVERLVAAGELKAPLWRSRAVLAAAQQLFEPDGARLVLRRWWADSGEALPEVTLAHGRPVAVLAAADRRHLLVVSVPATAANSGERYLWQIHSMTTGELVSSRRGGRSASPFCLVGGVLLHLEPPSARRVGGEWQEQPLRLRAADPDSGSELWQRPVRDPAYRGSLPPQP